MPGKCFDFDLNLDYYDDGDSINDYNSCKDDALLDIDRVKSGDSVVSGWCWGWQCDDDVDSGDNNK